MTRSTSPTPPWLDRVRLGAEIAVTVGSGVLSVIEALERHNQLQEHPEDGSLVPTTSYNPDEEEK